MLNFTSNDFFQPYENYSFEELRVAAPAVPRPSENMLVRSNNDGTYLVNWTPGSVGLYSIHVTIDGFDTGKSMIGPEPIYCKTFTHIWQLLKLWTFLVNF